MALRKTETSHHLSLDKANVPPEIFQKSSQLADLPQKPPPGELPPKPAELAPKPQIGELPPKPGELPPKPQLGDLPPKPQLSDLPPKPQMKDLPPKPQLGDLLAKSQTTDVSPKTQQPGDITQKSHPLDLSPNMQSRDAVPKQTSEDSNDLTSSLPETPVPLPRKINTVCVNIPVSQAFPIYNSAELQILAVAFSVGTENGRSWAHLPGDGSGPGVEPGILALGATSMPGICT